MLPKVSGLHHVTAIAGSAQKNLNFYAQVLGLRLVKQTVNFDDPKTYHLYYGDRLGRPGGNLTFFPWPDAPKGTTGTGLTKTTAYSAPPESLAFWRRRLEENGVTTDEPTERFRDSVFAFEDPDGLQLEIVFHEAAVRRAGWPDGAVPAEHALRSFHSVTLDAAAPEKTAELLTEVFGFEEVGEEGGRLRLRSRDEEAPARIVDLLPPSGDDMRLGRGVVHHVAFRARGDEEQARLREALTERGLNATSVRDRHYFRSIYFRDERWTSGVLFEIATDGPGFTLDEAPDELGSDLKLPPHLEARREELVRELPALDVTRAPLKAASNS